MNINRDYLIINDVKKSNIKLDNGSMFFYITDKNTQNIFVNLVINVSNNDLIQKYANIENAEDYILTMNIVKPDNTHKVIEGKLHDKENAIFEFNLEEDCCDEIGTYRCELLTKCNIDNREEITTSNKLTYKVKSSVLNDLDDIVEAPEYPLVIQLFDKLSDIDQYEEDRRANELARQLAEEQRQTRFDALDADMTGSMQAIDNKVAEVENRITTKEQAVDKLINDTKADTDEYKVAKDQEIDEYKTAKDTEINEAISNQNDRITAVENNVATQNNRLDIVENKNQQQDNRLNIIEAKNVEQDNRLNEIEAIDVAQNTRLDAIEAKNQQQDDRLLDIEKVNKRQDIDLKCLFTEAKNNMMDITEEGNSIYLQNSTEGHIFLDEIKGNTLVNCNKEPDKELILNGNINTSGDNAVTLTEGVDGGLVDVALEGNTLVNVSKTKDNTAITKAYTVENSGNHIALQGEYDGKCRPVVTGNTLVNILQKREPIDINKTTNTWYMPLITPNKLNTEYTMILNLSNLNLDNQSDIALLIRGNLIDETYTNTSIDSTKIKDNIIKLKWIETEKQFNDILIGISGSANPNNPTFTFENMLILEGDYTDKPIPDYFTGLQSTFEDNLVTQEMVDNGEEIADNLGKYKVEYKVTGKNKFDVDNVVYKAIGSNTYYGTVTKTGNSFTYQGNKDNADGNFGIQIRTKLKPNTTYYLSYKYKKINTGASCYIRVYTHNSIKLAEGQVTTFTTTDDDYYIFNFYGSFGAIANCQFTISDIQLEEGNTATSYEPYKEYTKTLYLNSPLLEGDTIEEKDGGIYHVHRSELVEYTEGDETSLITDRVHTLHQLASPTYELIEQSNLVIPSYANGHLDFSTAVPVEKVDFLPFIEELTYLYTSTQYTVQFISDRAILADFILGGTQLLAQSIVAGLNRISITTPATLVDNKLVIDGIGANISEVVVTDTDKEFRYFEGMKSVGEGGNLVITSSNSDNTLSNTQQLTHEPLRAVGDAKDRYVLIDGKWYIERNCGKAVFDGSDDEQWMADNQYGDNGDVSDCTGYKIIVEDLIVTPNGFMSSMTNFKLKCNLLPFVDTYSRKVNAINSGWGNNLYIKFDRYIDDNELRDYLKYNILEITYPLASPQYEPIDYNPLEVYSSTTHITTNSVIPTNVTVKNHGYNCLLKPSTTYTISSNLGLNTATTPSTLTEDCLRFMDTDTSDVTTMRDVLVLEGDWTTKADLIPTNFSGIESAFEQEYDAEKGKYKVNVKVANEDKTSENNITFYINEPLRGVGDVKDRVYVKDDKVLVQRNCGIRAYEDGDFGTYITDKINTVYPLATPTYEEIEYNDTKLFIESFKNSTLLYNSNVPVTSTVHYSYSVPIVDTVAQTANVTDQQDSMIIDLATQVAVMEMMLM